MVVTCLVAAREAYSSMSSLLGKYDMRLFMAINTVRNLIVKAKWPSVGHLRPPGPFHRSGDVLLHQHAGAGERGFRDLPAPLATCGGHFQTSLVPPELHERVHGPGHRELRCQAGRGLLRVRLSLQMALIVYIVLYSYSMYYIAILPILLHDTKAYSYASKERGSRTASARVRAQSTTGTCRMALTLLRCRRAASWTL